MEESRGSLSPLAACFADMIGRGGRGLGRAELGATTTSHHVQSGHIAADFLQNFLSLFPAFPWLRWGFSFR